MPAPLQTRPSHAAYHARFDRCWPNGTNVRTEIRHKNCARVPPFKVTGTDTDRTSYYMYWYIMYHFQHIARYWPKCANFFPNQRFYSPPPWNCLATFGLKKYQNGGATWPSEILMIPLAVLIQYANVKAGQADTCRRPGPPFLCAHIVRRAV